ncbi:MAG TPA: TonB C-terminal domain-containing protein [Stellaceae bacterium]|nr:TonB C-terminal domain-containing protein [Stellaceae bacterium]
MSEGETSGSPMILPADWFIRTVESDEKRQRPPWLAMVAAALMHALVLLAVIMSWLYPTVPPSEPDVIPVKVVFAPPPAPPPPVPAEPAPKAAPSLAYRESGPDQRTTAPPPAEMPAPEPATPPPPTSAATPAEKEPPPPPEKPAPEKQPQESAKPSPHKDLARLEPPKKEAETMRAPRLAPPRRLDVEPGERFESGDPYLNQLHALIERHRIYPRVVGTFGLLAEGMAAYDVLLDRSGRIIGMRLSHSSGIAGIDQAVEGMIRSSLPFPPLPADYPDEVNIVVAIRLFPPS